MPKFNCCTALGIVIWNEHSRRYTCSVHRGYIQITLSRWRLEHYIFQRNKHSLFSIADSQRQANIKRQGRSKTCRATVSHPVDKYGKPGDSTACGSACYLQLKAMKSCLNLPKRKERSRRRNIWRGKTHDSQRVSSSLLLCWSCVWTWRARKIAQLLPR